MVISEKWDACLERTVMNFGIGILAGGLASVVLTREFNPVSQPLLFDSDVFRADCQVLG